MDIEEFETRIDQIIRETGVSAGPDASMQDLDRRKAQFDALEMELLKTQQEKGGALELLNVLLSIRDSLTNSGFLAPDTYWETQDIAIFGMIERGDVAGVRAALKVCDVNARYGQQGETPLYRAMSLVRGGSIEIMNVLLDCGADPKIGLKDGNVLHGLGVGNSDDLISVEMLLPVVLRCVALGADIEQRTDKLGWTPLIAAVSDWNPVVSEVLLLAGADITVKAGERDGACLSGAGLVDFARGDPETMAVLKIFMARQ